ncbi:hypothetical protein [Vibrio rarus]|uniref:hypothetical protein n=1 Tax=Vibrio rarus TaxID=413403 RepID=UPI0021C37A3E|nr:hypothetical protein [Vibrio rarus]
MKSKFLMIPLALAVLTACNSNEGHSTTSTTQLTPVVNTAEIKAPETKASEAKPPATQPTKVETPKTKAPETNNKAIKTPIVNTPLVKTSEVKTPVVNTAETKAPETKAPEAKTPVTQPTKVETPKTKAPETNNKAIKTPIVNTPLVKTSEVKTPVVNTAETKAPETKAPEVKTPVTQPTKVETPKTKAPETNNKAIKTPIVNTPLVKTSEVKTPVVNTAETKAPETKAPEVKTPVTQPTKVETPKTKAPETNNKAIKTPIVNTPLVKTSEVKTPVVNTAETKAPETKAPKVKTPATQPTKVKTHKTKTPETKTPKVKTPATQLTKVKTHKTKTPETKAPEVKNPATQLTKVETPKTKAPETKAPKVKPPATQPTKVETPKTEAPETKAPEVKTPVTQPTKVETPKTKAPETKAPEAKSPVTQPTKVETPKTKAPKTKPVKVVAPKTKSPETKAPKVKPPATQPTKVKTHKTKTPETKAPEVKNPATQLTKVETPKTKAPETKAPKVKPPATQPTKVETPKTEAPETKAPEVKTPVTQPTKVETPKTKAPETKAPEAKSPVTQPTKVETPKTKAPKTEPVKVAAQKPVIHGTLSDDLESSTLSESWVKYSGGSDAMGLTTDKANGGTQSLLIKDSSSIEETHVALLFKDQNVENGTVTFDTLIPSSNDDDTYFVLSDTTNSGFYTLHLKDEDLYLEGNYSSKLVGHVSRDKWHTISMKWDRYSGNYTTSVDGANETTVMIFTIDQFVNRIKPSQLLITTGSETGTGNNVYIDNVAFNLDGSAQPTPVTAPTQPTKVKTPKTKAPKTEPVKVAAQKPVIHGTLGDDLESSTISESWVKYTGSSDAMRLTSAKGTNSTQSLLIKDSSSIEETHVALLFKDQKVENGTVTFDTLIASSNDDDTYFVLSDTTNSGFYTLHLKDEALYLEGNHGSKLVGHVSCDQWHTISMKWDRHSGNYTTSVDGANETTVMIFTIDQFVNRIKPSQLLITTGSETGTGNKVYIDNVAFNLDGSAQPTPVTAPTQPTKVKTPKTKAPKTKPVKVVAPKTKAPKTEPVKVAAQKPVIHGTLGDDLESSTISESWVKYTGGFDAMNLTPAKGTNSTQSLLIKDSSSIEETHVALLFKDQNVENGTVTFDTLIPSSNDDDTYFVLSDTTNPGFYTLHLKDEDLYLEGNHGSKLVGHVSCDQWHTISMKWDRHSGNYTTSVDGANETTVMIFTIDQFVNRIKPSQLLITTGSETGTGNKVYIDNVAFNLDGSAQPAPVTAPTQPTKVETPKTKAPKTKPVKVVAPKTKAPKTEPVKVAAQKPVIHGTLGDDLESSTISESWVKYTGGFDAMNLTPAKGTNSTQSLLIKDSSSTEETHVALLFKDQQVENGTVTFDTLIPSSNDDDTYFVLSDTTNPGVYTLHLKDEDLYLEGNHGSKLVGHVSRDEWHTISMKWDYKTGVYTTSVDGENATTVMIFTIDQFVRRVEPSQLLITTGSEAGTGNKVYIDHVAFNLDGSAQPTPVTAPTHPTKVETPKTKAPKTKPVKVVAPKTKAPSPTQPAVSPSTHASASGDDFESYAVGDTVGGDWKVPDASKIGLTAIISKDQVASGSEKSLLLKDNSTTDKPYVALPFKSDATSGAVSLDAFFPAANENFTYIKIGKSSNNKDRYIEIKQEAEKLVIAHTKSVNDEVIEDHLTLDTWHTFKISWTESNKYTINLDGSDIVKDADQTATGYGDTVPTELGLYTGDTKGDTNLAYFDNVKSDLF